MEDTKYFNKYLPGMKEVAITIGLAGIVFGSVGCTSTAASNTTRGMGIDPFSGSIYVPTKQEMILDYRMKELSGKTKMRRTERSY